MPMVMGTLHAHARHRGARDPGIGQPQRHVEPRPQLQGGARRRPSRRPGRSLQAREGGAARRHVRHLSGGRARRQRQLSGGDRTARQRRELHLLHDPCAGGGRHLRRYLQRRPQAALRHRQRNRERRHPPGPGPRGDDAVEPESGQRRLRAQQGRGRQQLHDQRRRRLERKHQDGQRQPRSARPSSAPAAASRATPIRPVPRS